FFVGETPTDGAKQHPLRVGSGNTEIRARRLAALASANPVGEMSGRALQHGGRLVVAFHLRTRNQADTLTAAPGPQVALGTDEDLVKTSNIFLGQPLGYRKILCQVALVPVDGHRRHFSGFDVLVRTLRELKLARVTRVSDRIYPLPRGTLDARGIAELQGPI